MFARVQSTAFPIREMHLSHALQCNKSCKTKNVLKKPETQSLKLISAVITKIDPDLRRVAETATLLRQQMQPTASLRRGAPERRPRTSGR